MKQLIRLMLLVLVGTIFVLNAPLFALADNATVQRVVDEGLRDVKSPVNFAQNPWLWVIIVAVFITGLIALWRIMGKKNTYPSAGSPVDTRLPWEIAIAELEALQQRRLLEEGHFKEFYSGLSDIIRMYFERRFHVKAPEMTTEEFLWSLNKSGHLSEPQTEILKEFLTSCDIVKFAKYVPRAEEGHRSFHLAKRLVDETRPAAQPANQSASVS